MAQDDYIPNFIQSIYFPIFNADSGYISHKSVHYNLLKQLRYQHFNVIREYPLYDIFYHKEDGSINIRNGHLDIYAELSNKALSIEYDTHKQVKMISFSKLLQAPSEYNFALIGGLEDKDLIEHNLNRFANILNVFKHILEPNVINEIRKKRFWLGIARLGYFQEITSYIYNVFTD